jgi:hypothetical protein
MQRMTWRPRSARAIVVGACGGGASRPSPGHGGVDGAESPAPTEAAPTGDFKLAL